MADSSRASFVALVVLAVDERSVFEWREEDVFMAIQSKNYPQVGRILSLVLCTNLWIVLFVVILGNTIYSEIIKPYGNIIVIGTVNIKPHILSCVKITTAIIFGMD